MRWEGARKETGEQGLGSRQGACREIHARSKRRSSRTCASPEASSENQGESSGLGGRLTPSLGTLILGHSKMASQCLLPCFVGGSSLSNRLRVCLFPVRTKPLKTVLGSWPFSYAHVPASLESRCPQMPNLDQWQTNRSDVVAEVLYF